MKRPDNASYNATFTYPEGRRDRIRQGARKRGAPRGASRSAKRSLAWTSTAKWRGPTQARDSLRAPRLDRRHSTASLAMSGLEHDTVSLRLEQGAGASTSASTGKGRRDVHWVYFPDKTCSFYRVGFYDNIFDDQPDEPLRRARLPARRASIDVEATQARVLRDLEVEGVVDGHRLVASHAVVMDPAYVHITRGRMAEHARLSAMSPRARRLLGRALRRLDVLLDRGRHRRGAGPHGRARRM